MAWKLSQLHQHLKAGDLKPVYLVAGEEHLLVLEAADAIRARARELGYNEREVLEAGESGFEWYQLGNAVSALSLFATRRLFDLRLPGGKPGKEGAEALIAFAEAAPADTVLLVTCTTWSKAHETAWVETFERQGAFVPLWPLKAAEISAWVAQRAVQRDVQLSADAIEALVERVEGNLLAAAQEVDKLVLLAPQGQRVDAALLESLVADHARFDVFGLADAMVAGDGARALRIARALRAEGEQVPGLLGWLTTQLNVLARLAGAVERGASVDAALRNERVWQTRMALYRGALQRGRTAFWEAMLAYAAKVERVGKGRAAGDPWRELERLIAMVTQPKSVRALGAVG